MADETVNQAAPAAAPAAEGTAAPAPRTGGYQGGGQGGARPGGARPPRPGGGAGGPGGRKFFRRKKVCKFTVEKIDTISYRDVRLLQQFVSDRNQRPLSAQADSRHQAGSRHRAAALRGEVLSRWRRRTKPPAPHRRAPCPAAIDPGQSS
jgi:small subunit ribosomal protein S18